MHVSYATVVCLLYFCTYGQIYPPYNHRIFGRMLLCWWFCAAQCVFSAVKWFVCDLRDPREMLFAVYLWTACCSGRILYIWDTQEKLYSCWTQTIGPLLVEYIVFICEQNEIEKVFGFCKLYLPAPVYVLESFN